MQYWKVVSGFGSLALGNLAKRFGLHDTAHSHLRVFGRITMSKSKQLKADAESSLLTKQDIDSDSEQVRMTELVLAQNWVRTFGNDPTAWDLIKVHDYTVAFLGKDITEYLCSKLKAQSVLGKRTVSISVFIKDVCDILAEGCGDNLDLIIQFQGFVPNGLLSLFKGRDTYPTPEIVVGNLSRLTLSLTSSVLKAVSAFYINDRLVRKNFVPRVTPISKDLVNSIKRIILELATVAYEMTRESK